jgi:hypothetical protein
MRPNLLRSTLDGGEVARGASSSADVDVLSLY